MTLRAAAGTDLLALTAELVDIPSVSHNEAAIAGFVEAWLRSVGDGVLDVARIGDNVCARTSFGLDQRLMLAGHLDTVPPNGNDRARIEGDVLSGLGSADMKGGVAVFLEMARAVCASSGAAGLRADLTWIFYACEEVERRYSGLVEIEAAEASWLEADAAVLGEPTASLVEAGCQGVLKVGVELRGRRAHTARPWMGRNAIHALAPVLAAVAEYEARCPVIDGCEYREALQAVAVEGGVANNVVPDVARVVLNHRYAPDRSADEAFEAVRALVMDAIGPDEPVSVTLEDLAAPAAPRLTHPLLASLVEASGQAPRAKLGWTDVSYFASRGVPAANFGPGEPTLAHSAGECVDRGDLDRAFETLSSVVG
ncbi:MAG: succinyl-diaminopimelate desuccinylase [Acidimicrobiales bacterium]